MLGFWSQKIILNRFPSTCRRNSWPEHFLEGNHQFIAWINCREKGVLFFCWRLRSLFSLISFGSVRIRSTELVIVSLKKFTNAYQDRCWEVALGWMFSGIIYLFFWKIILRNVLFLHFLKLSSIWIYQKIKQNLSWIGLWYLLPIVLSPDLPPSPGVFMVDGGFF